MEPWVRDLIAVRPSVPKNIDKVFQRKVQTANSYRHWKFVSDDCLDWSMCCHLDVPIIVIGDMFGVVRSPITGNISPAQSLTTPSLESQKQTSPRQDLLVGQSLRKWLLAFTKAKLLKCSCVSWLSYAKQEESYSRDNLIRSLSSLSALRLILVRYILGTLVTL